MAGITIPKAAIPAGYQKLTVSNSAVGLTVPINSDIAIIVCDDANVRYRDDGTDPTATDGMPVESGQTLAVEGDNSLADIRFIRQASTDATLHISYYDYN